MAGLVPHTNRVVEEVVMAKLVTHIIRVVEGVTYYYIPARLVTCFCPLVVSYHAT